MAGLIDGRSAVYEAPNFVRSISGATKLKRSCHDGFTYSKSPEIKEKEGSYPLNTKNTISPLQRLTVMSLNA